MGRLSVDIGGTFTDSVFVDDVTGEVRFDKAPSTPSDYSEGLVNSISELGEHASIDFFVHGTTVCLNAILQGRLAPTAFVTTRGFRDVLEIQRSNRPEIYDPFYTKPRPLIPRTLRFEVRERMAYDGTVLEAVDVDDLRAVGERIRAAGVRAIGICFLHSYANDAHERQAAEILRDAVPDADITISTAVAREWREYERSSTAAFNAGLMPIMRSYLTSLEGRMSAFGYSKDMHIMQSNGGITTSELAKETPVHTLNSGVVGGVIAVRSLMAEQGSSNAIGADMGGTSFDVSLIVNGDYRIQPTLDIRTPSSNDHSYPILMPTIDIHAVGAGGGSIAWIDDGGGLHVGPISAGADPGPAGYGRGGTEATITDANIALGRLDPSAFLGGRFTIFPELSRSAVGRVAERLGADIERTAEGIVAIAVTNMANAIRTMTVDRGIDPRDFVLVSFGGAGSLHASLIAEELKIREVLVPPLPGNFAAWGLLAADIKHDYHQTFVASLADAEAGKVEAAFGALETTGQEALSREGISAQSRTFLRSMDLRYIGQGHALAVPVPGEHFSDVDRSLIAARFDEAHLQTYLHNAPEEGKQIVSLKVTAIGGIASPEWPKSKGSGATSEKAMSSVRPVYLGGRWEETGIYKRSLLEPGMQVSGPAVVEEDSSTTLVLPAQTLRVDERGTMSLNWKAG